MDLNRLSAFVVVAETSSFSAAAKKLGLIRSSVSRSVGALAPLAKVKPQWLGDDVSFVANAVAAGVGLGLIPTFLVRDRVAAGTVVRVLPRVSVSAGALYLVYPPTRHPSRKVSALRDFLVEHFTIYPLTTASVAP